MQQQNQYFQDNVNSVNSSIHQKREGFRKEIRSNRLSQDFASRRKIFFREQMAHVINTYKNEFVELNSWDQVREQLTSTFMPNYQGIHKFIEQNHAKGIPKDIEQVLISSVQSGDFLTNEHALVLLVTLTNVRKNEKAILDSGMIKLIVDNLLKWNLVKEEEWEKYEGKVHYFETVCWVLFALAVICEENFQETFETFRQNMKAFETHQARLSYEQVALFAEFSTRPSFLPSQQFIRHIIQNSLHPHTPPLKTLQLQVYLLDNFMRYKQQNSHRFNSEESLELAVIYLEFILERLEDMKFGRQQKLELVNLLTALVKSAGDQVLEKMFGGKKTQRLAVLIFKKAEFDEWMGKKASLICVLNMLCNPILLPILNRLYGPKNIAYLSYNSLLLPDADVRSSVVSTMFCLCQMEPKTYLRQFRKYNLTSTIEKLYLIEENTLLSEKDNHSLAQELHFLHDQIERLDENIGQNVWGRDGGMGEGDVEI